MTPDIATTTLANGLRVVSAALPHLHTTTLAMFVKVGSRFERPDDNGLSHFLEHMLFRGTAAYPDSRDLNLAVERLGSALHAETGRDLSLFTTTIEPRLVGEGLALFGEIFGCPRFADIELERRLILEEMNEDYDEDGVEINGDDIARGLIFGAHPLAQRIIGSRANVRGFTDADVRRHFERHYTGANMLVMASGPVAHDALVTEAERHLAGLPAGAAVPVEPVQPSQDRVRYKYVRDSGAQTAIHILFRAVPDMAPEYMASAALLRAIDDGMSTPLHYELCDQKGLAYSIQAGIEPLADTALFEVSGATSPAKIAELIGDVLALLGRFRDQPVSDAELERIKRRYRLDLLSALDDGYAVANWYGGAALYYSPPSFAERAAEMEAITAEHIRAAAAHMFRPERLAVAVVGPLSRARRNQVREIVVKWR
ncbi:M16 family metallopeptidase [Haliangium sp.]|uniref:M16 family metallopeptidase n=1 Tax=Haliangium sp. TaxID=2663208 RepID=UPI003D10093E